MKKPMAIYLVAILIILTAGVTKAIVDAFYDLEEEKAEVHATQNVKSEVVLTEAEKELLLIKQKQKDDTDLGNFILLLMDQVKAKMSPARKQIVIRTIIRVTNDILETKHQKQNFAVLLAIENKFSNSGKSPVGATGISQLMPKYAPEFAKICGITDYKKSDLKDLELNLYLGACQFKTLLNSPTINGNVAAALVGYNAGKHSKSFKELVGLRRITLSEPSNYVAKYTYLNEEVKNVLLSQAEVVKKKTTKKKKKGKK